MANFCSNCGSSVREDMTFCPSCGHALRKSSGASASYTDTASYETAQPQSSGIDAASAAVGALGTLVAVNLIGGLTRQLYYRGGRYYLDPYCMRPFGNPHLILGRRLLGRPFMPPPPPRPMMHRPPMPRGPFGGPRPPFGGPRGPRPPMGGPRGGRGRR